MTGARGATEDVRVREEVTARAREEVGSRLGGGSKRHKQHECRCEERCRYSCIRAKILPTCFRRSGASRKTVGRIFAWRITLLQQNCIGRSQY